MKNAIAKGMPSEGGSPAVGPIDGQVAALGATESNVPKISPENVREAQEAQLKQAISFYEQALRAVKGGLDLLELGYFPGKLGAKIGPAIRYMRMVESQTKAEVSRLENEMSGLRNVAPVEKKG